nr:MAG TPA: hypothetical protein [Caudoviricetes sp.]DAZ33325.1 MAG TPA: hypothetical protein [Caudoviricetes sp.]
MAATVKRHMRIIVCRSFTGCRHSFLNWIGMRKLL